MPQGDSCSYTPDKLLNILLETYRRRACTPDGVLTFCQKSTAYQRTYFRSNPIPSSPFFPYHPIYGNPLECFCTKVGFAVEFEAMSEDSDRSDFFGQSISLGGGLLLTGAPKKHRDVPEVQLIVSKGTASEVRVVGKWSLLAVVDNDPPRVA